MNAVASFLSSLAWLIFLLSQLTFNTAHATQVLGHDTNTAPLALIVISDMSAFPEIHKQDTAITPDSMDKIWRSLITHSQPKLMPKFQKMSLTRAWVEFQKLPNACMINKVKNPKREAIAEFSHYPFSIFPPVRLIALAKNQHKFSQPFSLQDLESQSGRKLRIGVVKSRSYGAEIDNFIATHPKHFFIRGAEDSMSKLIDMLFMARIDAIIDFSQVVTNHKQETEQPQQIIAIPIHEAAGPMHAYVVCSKTPKGKAIIAAINHSFQHNEVQETFRTFHQLYFGHQEYLLLAPLIDNIFSSSQTNRQPDEPAKIQAKETRLNTSSQT
ncbi:hypothetical protein [Shewanella sp.]|uniref:hypothetical protein n=1 Tax=Shewanella sp. TaxID=50422 RepID=UPI0040539FB7